MITERQKEILDFIKEYWVKKSIYPSLEEIKKNVGLSSISTVHHHIKALEELGYLHREENRPRGLNVFEDQEMVSVPILGKIAAGAPIEAIEEKQESIAISRSKLPHSGEMEIYALRVEGNSMVDENIFDGDIVIIKRQDSAEDGEKVVALIDKENATLKKLYRDKDKIRLQPANTSFLPIFVEPDNLIIQGVVISIIRNQQSVQNKQDQDIEWLKIDETIKELAYLTHDFFRYYGKFPSKVAKILIERYTKPGDLILDNYVGSGTTMVEARLAECNSIGIDINPLAILASNVKSRIYNISSLKKSWTRLQEKIDQITSLIKGEKTLFTINKTQNKKQLLKEDYINYTPKNFPNINKWFSEATIKELAILKKLILDNIKNKKELEFFLVAYTAIIRRVSVAYDGEVRPHVNLKKKPRPVFKAFHKKVNEMLIKTEQFAEVANKKTNHCALIADNRNLTKIDSLKKDSIDLVISHPPYLNCFDYIPVYNLELRWIEEIKTIMRGFTYDEIKKMEIRSWPATNEKIFKGYFDNNRITYSQTFDLLKKGGRCCIVIGDATMRGELISTHKEFIKICKKIGFVLDHIIYRTTSYGTGKYAYAKRADYHNKQEGKRDAILIFKKP